MNQTNSSGPSLADDFRNAMRRLATTVTIVTALDDGRPVGMAATAVTSLSTEPPALLVCVNRNASMHPSLAIGKPISINLLTPDHTELTFAFGGKVAPAERFGHGDWVLDDSGVPCLADAQASLSCTIDAIFDYATHSIVVGKVNQIRFFGDVRPLLFGDGKFIGL